MSATPRGWEQILILRVKGSIDKVEVDFALNPGEIALFNNAMIHSSNANFGNDRRMRAHRSLIASPSRHDELTSRAEASPSLLDGRALIVCLAGRVEVALKEVGGAEEDECLRQRNHGSFSASSPDGELPTGRRLRAWC